MSLADDPCSVMEKGVRLAWASPRHVNGAWKQGTRLSPKNASGFRSGWGRGDPSRVPADRFMGSGALTLPLSCGSRAAEPGPRGAAGTLSSKHEDRNLEQSRGVDPRSYRKIKSLLLREIAGPTRTLHGSARHGPRFPDSHQPDWLELVREICAGGWREALVL